MPVSFLIAPSTGFPFSLPPRAVITGVGFSVLNGASVALLLSGPETSVDLGATTVNQTVIALVQQDATHSVNVFYDGLKIALKDGQQLFSTGADNTAFCLIRIETPN